MQHISHIDDDRHTYCYRITVTGHSEFDLTVRDFTAQNADKHLDGLLREQETPFACATLTDSTDPYAAARSRATDKR